MTDNIVRCVVDTTVSTICDFLDLRVKLILKTKNDPVTANDPELIKQLGARIDEINELLTFLNTLLDSTHKVCKENDEKRKKQKIKVEMPKGDQTE